MRNAPQGWECMVVIPHLYPRIQAPSGGIFLPCLLDTKTAQITSLNSRSTCAIITCILTPSISYLLTVSFVVFDIVVLVFSGTAAIAQALFQISLATGYTLDECKYNIESSIEISTVNAL